MAGVKRVVLAVLGAILGLVGLGVLGAGLVLLSIFGTDGKSEIPVGQVQAEAGRAVVVTDFQISSSAPIPLNESWFDLAVGVTGAQSHFVGVATKEQALDYLQGVPYALVTDFDSSSGRIDSTQIPGDRRPPDPALQTFWSDQQIGDSVSVAWPVSDEDTALVVMNKSGSAPVKADLQVLLTVAWAGAAAIGLAIAGLIVVILAIVLLVLAMRAGSEKASTVA